MGVDTRVREPSNVRLTLRRAHLRIFFWQGWETVARESLQRRHRGYLNSRKVNVVDTIEDFAGR